MKIGCVVICLLGALGYTLLLIPMVTAFGHPKAWLDDIDKWLRRLNHRCW
jgi:hypothetical protein